MFTGSNHIASLPARTEPEPHGASESYTPLAELATVPTYRARPDGSLATPWFTVPQGAPVELAAVIRGGPADVHVDWARAAGERDPLVADVVSSSTLASTPRDWRIVRLTDRRPASAAQFRLVGEGAADLTISVIAGQPNRLASYLQPPTLVSPPQLPLFTCTTPPAIVGGIAEAPRLAIGFENGGGDGKPIVRDIGEIGSATGPWFLAGNVFETRTIWAWFTDDDAARLVQTIDASLGQLIAPTIVLKR